MGRFRTAVCLGTLFLSGYGFAQADDAARGPDDSTRAAACRNCPITTIDKGEISAFRFDEAGYLGSTGVIRTQRSWLQFWRHHTSNVHPAPPAPLVNFGRSIVLVAVQGPQTSGGGPEITIARVYRCGANVTARFIDDETPGPLDVITNPYHIVSVPTRCVTPTASVEFVATAPGHFPGSLAGRVFGANDAMLGPIPRALVQLFRPTEDGTEPFFVAETYTGKRGWYGFEELRPGMYLAIASAEGFAPAEHRVEIISAATTVQNFLLRPFPGPFSGIVGQVRGGPVEEDTHPLAGAHVFLFTGWDPPAADAFVDETFTSNLGLYRFLELEPGRYHLAVFADGYEPARANVEVPPDEVIEQSFELLSE